MATAAQAMEDHDRVVTRGIECTVCLKAQRQVGDGLPAFGDKGIRYTGKRGILGRWGSYHADATSCKEKVKRHGQSL
jgi:hypothetical protein